MLYDCLYFGVEGEDELLYGLSLVATKDVLVDLHDLPDDIDAGFDSAVQVIHDLDVDARPRELCGCDYVGDLFIDGDGIGVVVDFVVHI